MGNEEKIIPEKDRLGIVQALGKVHELRDLLEQMGFDDYVTALNRVLEWLNEIALILLWERRNRL